MKFYIVLCIFFASLACAQEVIPPDPDTLPATLPPATDPPEGSAGNS